MRKLLVLFAFVITFSANAQRVNRSTATHDFSNANALIKMDADIGGKKTLTCQIFWSGIVGSGAKVILRGSNIGNQDSKFDDLGVEIILTGTSGSATLSDDKFPHDVGAVFVEKNGVSAGIVTLRFLAK